MEIVTLDAVLVNGDVTVVVWTLCERRGRGDCALTFFYP